MTMWDHSCSIGVVGLILIILLGGCGLRSVETNRHQEDIGFGIVEGTKGYLNMLDNIRYSDEDMTKLQGQVLRIEGAAYVVQMKNHTQVRLPVDENTRIDRPAHVGDWIEANLDHTGRARINRNIDDQIILD